MSLSTKNSANLSARCQEKETRREYHVCMQKVENNTPIDLGNGTTTTVEGLLRLAELRKLHPVRRLYRIEQIPTDPTDPVPLPPAPDPRGGFQSAA